MLTAPISDPCVAAYLKRPWLGADKANRWHASVLLTLGSHVALGGTRQFQSGHELALHCESSFLYTSSNSRLAAPSSAVDTDKDAATAHFLDRKKLAATTGRTSPHEGYVT